MPKRSKSPRKSKGKSSTAYRLSLRVKKSPRKAKSLSKKSSRKSKSVSKGKMTWFQAVAKARKELKITGFVAINRGKDGIAIYKRAKELYGKAKTA